MGEEVRRAGVYLIKVAHRARPPLGQEDSLVPPPAVAQHVARPFSKAAKGRVSFGAVLCHASVRLEVFIDMTPGQGELRNRETQTDR